MEELSILSSESLDRYFTTLSKLGYKSLSEVKKLLALLFIGELLDSPMRFYITDKDLRLIDRFLYCLYGTTCLIPLPESVNNDNIFREFDYSKMLRIDNNFNLRTSLLHPNLRITKNYDLDLEYIDPDDGILDLEYFILFTHTGGIRLLYIRFNGDWVIAGL